MAWGVEVRRAGAKFIEWCEWGIGDSAVAAGK
jgi:hypothetical protein